MSEWVRERESERESGQQFEIKFCSNIVLMCITV